MSLFYIRIQYLFIFFLSIANYHAQANDFVKYRATFELKNFVGEQIVIAHYMGNKIYVNDTLDINKKGKFVFENDKELKAGLYLLVMPPENNMLEFIFNENEPKFSMTANVMNIPYDVTFKGSKDNTLLYHYFQYIKKENIVVDTLGKKVAALKEKEDDGKKTKREIKVLEDKIAEIRKGIVAEKKSFIKKAPKNSVTATYLRSQLEIEYPKFEGDADEIKLQKYCHRVNNFYSKLNGDKRFYRSKMFFDMTEFYTNRITASTADSVYKSIENTLDLVAYDKPLYNHYLIHFINKYVKPRIVGQDAVFVKLVDKYVVGDKAELFKEETKTKIIDQANKTRNILIGKIAPNIEISHFDYEGTLLQKDNKDEYKRFKLGESFKLHEFEKPYTVLFFWKPNCGHCTKAFPPMIAFYDKFKDKGIEVISHCIKTYKDMPACAQVIKDNNAIKWINTVDPFYRSQFAVKYDLTKTPKIFILDHKKEIIIKNIGAEQIERVMTRILDDDKKKKENK